MNPAYFETVFLVDPKFIGHPPDRFADKPPHTQYIFAFYWIFEVITTVGYGDYTGKTSNELLFSIVL